MSKYGFEELQMLYEDGFRGDAVNRNTNYDYGGKTERGLSAEFPALRGIKSEPIGLSTDTAFPRAIEDEEVVSKHSIKQKINELLDDAHERGMGYAIDHLHDLLQFVDGRKK